MMVYYVLCDSTIIEKVYTRTLTRICLESEHLPSWKHLKPGDFIVLKSSPTREELVQVVRNNKSTRQGHNGSIYVGDDGNFYADVSERLLNLAHTNKGAAALLSPAADLAYRVGNTEFRTTIIDAEPQTREELEECVIEWLLQNRNVLAILSLMREDVESASYVTYNCPFPKLDLQGVHGKSAWVQILLRAYKKAMFFASMRKTRY